MIMVPPYSIIFAVKIFANCPETAKFAKVFTSERFLLHGIHLILIVINNY